MYQESITKGLTTPVNVILAFSHLGFHVFDMLDEEVEDESCFNIEFVENLTSSVFAWNNTEMREV